MYPIAYPLSIALDKLLEEEMQPIWSKREIKEIIKTVMLQILMQMKELLCLVLYLFLRFQLKT